MGYYHIFLSFRLKNGIRGKQHYSILNSYHLSDKTGTLTENVMVFKEVQYMTIWRQRLTIIRRLAWEEVSSARPSCNIEDHYPCAPSQTWPAGDNCYSMSLV